jgi:glycosyltransferase involved in cell wall biosynthesis
MTGGAHLDDERVKYIVEVDDEKKRLYANAGALLMPIRWPEPFGLVMTEAMACGTPVIAYSEGAAPEIVVEGETGFVVNDESEMAPSSASTRSTPRAAARAPGSASTWRPWRVPTSGRTAR